MKKTLLFVSLFVAGASFAQDCSKLIISEYVEGWSNNKALEIYNPTNSAIDLSGYIVARASNGAAIGAVQIKNAVQLTGTVGAHDVFVAVLDKRDPNGTGQEAPVWEDLQLKADGFFAPDYAVSESFYWNGNDAIILFQGTLIGSPTTTLTSIVPQLVIVDIFGKVGENPGTAWTSIAPYNNGNGAELTKDMSLIRKSTVKTGVTNLGITSFNALAEYDSIPAVIYDIDVNGDTLSTDGNWNSLGVHSCECGDASIKKIAESTLTLFPNPSSDGLFHLNANAKIEEITVYNGLGQVVKNHKYNSENVAIRINDLPGVYIMRIQTENGIISKRVIVK
ncbi:MAG: T9SS type A sorting domain-containing protein [Bacteroidota bacterium]